MRREGMLRMSRDHWKNKTANLGRLDKETFALLENKKSKLSVQESFIRISRIVIVSLCASNVYEIYKEAWLTLKRSVPLTSEHVQDGTDTGRQTLLSRKLLRKTGHLGHCNQFLFFGWTILESAGALFYRLIISTNQELKISSPFFHLLYNSTYLLPLPVSLLLMPSFLILAPLISLSFLIPAVGG